MVQDFLHQQYLLDGLHMCVRGCLLAGALSCSLFLHCLKLMVAICDVLKYVGLLGA